MKHQSQQTLRYLSALIALHFLVYIGLPGGVSQAYAKLPADLNKGINILAEYKSNAKQHAQLLVNLAACEEITKDTYYLGQSLYAQAKAGFDGWIDQLVFEIESGTLETLTPTHKAIQENAKAKGDEFVEHVLKQIQSSTRGPTARKMISIFESIKEVALLIARDITKVSPTEQSEVIQKLKGYKWPAFHTIEESLQ